MEERRTVSAVANKDMVLRFYDEVWNRGNEGSSSSGTTATTSG